MNGFRKGSGCYVCRDCGKRTRATGSSEEYTELCLRCFDAAGIENEHTDGHHAGNPHPDCSDCTKNTETPRGVVR